MAGARFLSVMSSTVSKSGAIRCSFYWKDASYGGAQYMWRGRWGCMAGRNRYEVENAVNEDGSKQFDYIHISPVSLKANWR